VTTAVRCALVGCGVVATQYADTLGASPLTELVACVDLDLARAKAFGHAHGIAPARSLDALLTDGAVDLAVVLTPPDAHVAVARQAVTAGVAVYVEKPIGLDVGEVLALLELADRSGVTVGAAPDTFIAPPAEAARAALRAGLIGEPVGATALMLSTGPEGWHPTPEPFYGPLAGPLLDMGPYYLALLTDLLGPVTSVDGATAVTRPVRTIGAPPRAGETFVARSATHVTAALRIAGADGGGTVAVTLTTSFDVPATTCPHVEIYGTEGTLVLPDPNFHGGPVRIWRTAEPRWRELDQEVADRGPVGRGIGALNTAAAMRGAEPHRTTGWKALHVLETMLAIDAAARGGRTVPVSGPGSVPRRR